MNEQCWLGVDGIPATYSGAAYRDSIAAFTDRLNGHGLAVILELHWSAPSTVLADGQRPMPDRDYTPAFWRQVAERFGDNPSVVFDLFNEPFPDDNADTDEAWRCWRDGGQCAARAVEADGCAGGAGAGPQRSDGGTRASRDRQRQPGIGEEGRARAVSG